ncbi:hypothetical protein M3N64_04540 [Sporolactobacillus sp. CPB3-1]|uniref:DUF2178 domain-containing protein n=1 Tax=Sporolactobacillus mangiferae TaxID=2940498 RepID=A0ABT0M8N5_9BACL|nr:hypothetical protein [Sporolactobacillus mangiferae]MCL1631216.1 hypothetical protein [Sporolactobacillus mangiferae]
MKRLIFSFIMSVSMIVAFGAALIPCIQIAEGFASFIRSPHQFYVEVNLLPVVPLVILSLIEAVDYYLGRRKGRPSFWQYPLIIPAADERERAISAQATATAFRAIWFIAPFCAALMVLHPIVRQSIPAFPVFVLLIIPLVQICVYYFKIRKIYL